MKFTKPAPTVLNYTVNLEDNTLFYYIRKSQLNILTFTQTNVFAMIF